MLLAGTYSVFHPTPLNRVSTALIDSQTHRATLQMERQMQTRKRDRDDDDGEGENGFFLHGIHADKVRSHLSSRTGCIILVPTVANYRIASAQYRIAL
jgi:hypothetical protein